MKTPLNSLDVHSLVTTINLELQVATSFFLPLSHWFSLAHSFVTSSGSESKKEIGCGSTQRRKATSKLVIMSCHDYNSIFSSSFSVSSLPTRFRCAVTIVAVEVLPFRGWIANKPGTEKNGMELASSTWLVSRLGVLLQYPIPLWSTNEANNSK